MKTVVILSDTHYNIAPLQKLSTVLSVLSGAGYIKRYGHLLKG